MKGLQKKALVLALVAAPVCGVLMGPASASDGDSPLIDKETEGLVRKIVAKRFCKRVGASNEQKQKIEALIAATTDQTRPMREEMRHKLLDLSALMSSAEATEDQIKNQVADIRALREKLMDQRLSAVLKLRQILTIEQRQKIHQRVTEILSGDFGPREFNGRRIGFLLNR